MADMHMMLVDGKVQMVDLEPMIRRHRDAHVKARADLIDQAAALIGDAAFDLGESYEAAEAAMPGDMVNAAGGVALALQEVEMLRW